MAKQTADTLRQIKIFAVTHNNSWYEVWTYENETAHFVSVNAMCDGRPCTFTSAGHATADDASKWAIEKALNPHG